MILRALLTGLFCSVFALVMMQAAPALSVLQLMALSALSGFLGSLFATFVLRKVK